jgi:hypothetical protein
MIFHSFSELCDRKYTVLACIIFILIKFFYFVSLQKENHISSATSNVKSRWATIRAWVETRDFAIGERRYSKSDPRKYVDVGIITHKAFKNSDVILHPETNKFYSSKPPVFTFLSALVARELTWMFRWNFRDNLRAIVLTTTFIINALSLCALLYGSVRILEHFCKCTWTKCVLLFAIMFASFPLTFSVTLNNHTVAAGVAVILLLPFLLKPMSEKQATAFFYSGVGAGFLVTLEFPAAILLFLLVCALVISRAWFNLKLFSLGCIIPVLLLLYLNFVSFGSILPAYAFFGSELYDFVGSYWAKVHSGRVFREIDFLRDPWGIYLFHLTFGHHGLFSLTPILLFGLPALASGLNSGLLRIASLGELPFSRENFLQLATAICLMVVISFYVWQTNNYGGTSCAPRWLIWLTPLILLSSSSFLERYSGHLVFRILVYVALAVSVFSTWEPGLTPWRDPWIYNIYKANDWLSFQAYPVK